VELVDLVVELLQNVPMASCARVTSVRLVQMTKNVLPEAPAYSVSPEAVKLEIVEPITTVKVDKFVKATSVPLVSMTKSVLLDKSA